VYKKKQLSKWFVLDHYNLSISKVTSHDEGIYQCQVERTMLANEARSERVYLNVIGRNESLSI